ncbi:MAG: hemolysin family protein [Gemmatimonadota bacterium]|nr:hemolysin family protein [Gemmatimonadota bacterium]
MNAIALGVAAGAVAVATLAAAADGALLGGDAELEPSPAVVGAIRGRERAHRALALSRVLAHVLTGAALSRCLGIYRGDGIRGAAIALAAALVVVVLVEGIGRSLGFATAPRFILQFAPLVRALEILLSPVLKLGAALDSMFERLMPAPSIEERAEQREEATEQFRQVVAAEADVSRAEEALIHGVFSLGDTAVREVMVPRVDIVGIDSTTRWSEAVDRVRSSEHARFPVYEETLDNVIGILYAKDLLPFVIDDDEPMMGWRTLVRPATFIPTSKPIDVQLREFKASHTHIAIVSDEFGGTAGLITIEDVLEEIVGEINDEYDDKEPEIEQEAGTRFWVNGRISLAELSELLSHAFEQDDIETVGGLVYETFGRVPRAGESAIVGSYRMVVERVRGRRIERVYFERVSAEPPLENE